MTEKPEEEQLTTQPESQPENHQEYEAGNAPIQAARTETRRGRLPRGFLVRILLIGISLIAICGVTTLIIFQIMRNSRKGPIDIEVFPKAQLVTESKGTNKDSRFYTTDASVKDVYTYYRSRLGEGDSRGCRLIYTTAEPTEEAGKYFARCIIDNSQDDLTQLLMITITYGSEDGLTRVLYERVWGS